MKPTAEELLKKFSVNTSHSNEVKKLSLMIFDGISETLKDMSDTQRRFLENAALLHDIGYAKGSENHHKNSLKIVLDYGLENYSENEKQIIGCICRYHRGSLPDKKNHEIYCLLNKKDRKTVKRLGGILRIADGLDKGHVSLIKKIRINYDASNNITEIYLTQNNADFHPDITYAVRKKDLFELAFKTQVVFKFEA